MVARSSEGRGGRTLELPTVVLGPLEKGRGYTVLRHSGLDQRATAVESGLSHLSLAMAAWADRRAADCAVMVPLDAGDRQFAVARMAYLGAAELGTVAMANVAILDAAAMTALDWMPHRLLPFIPHPDHGSDFAARPLAVDPGAVREAAPTTRFPSFGLEWADHEIDVGDADPEAILAAAIEGLDPPIQRLRLRGWATTGLLARSGGFDPDQAFNLITHKSREPVRHGGKQRRKVVLGPGPIEYDADLIPMSWRIWSLVETLTRAAGKARGLAWEPRYAAMDPARMAALAVYESALALDAQQRVDLLIKVVATAGTVPEIAEALLQGNVLTLREWMDQSPDDEGKAFYLNAYIEGNLRRPDVIRTVAPLAVPVPILSWVTASTFAALLSHGLPEAMVTSNDRPDAEALTALQMNRRLALLKTVIARPSLSPLWVDAFLAVLSEPEPGQGNELKEALATILESDTAHQDARLLTVEAYDLADQSGSTGRAAYARQILSPRLNAGVGTTVPAYLEALRITATALHRGEAA